MLTVEDNMRRTFLLATALMLASPLASGQASAASAPNVAWAKSKAIAGSVVDQAGYRHCARWNWRCSKRWGYGSPRYARCLWRHGC
jgi:hypothetical protein